MTLAQLLSDQFADDVPDYELDQKSQDILFEALKEHAQIKSAKQQLLETINARIEALESEIECQRGQQASVSLTPAGKLVAQVAGELGCVGPSAADALKEMIKLEASMIANDEKLDEQRKQLEELRKSEQILQQIDQFVGSKEAEVQKAALQIQPLKNETLRFRSQTEELSAKSASLNQKHTPAQK